MSELQKQRAEVPKLPKKRKAREAKYDGLVAQWFEKNYDLSVALEVKIKGGRTPRHQKNALRSVLNGSFSYKIPDMGRVNPFDYVILKGADAFIVVVEPDTGVCTAFDPVTNNKQFSFKI